MRFWVQCLAPAGNWYDVMGCNSLEKAFEFARYQWKMQGHRARVVERADRVVKELGMPD